MAACVAIASINRSAVPSYDGSPPLTDVSMGLIAYFNVHNLRETRASQVELT